MLRVRGHTRTFRLAGSREVACAAGPLVWGDFLFAEDSKNCPINVNVTPPIVLTIAGFRSIRPRAFAADLKTIAAHSLLWHCGHHGAYRAVHPGREIHT